MNKAHRSGTEGNLYLRVSDHQSYGINKVTVVGVGSVGMSCAISILTEGLSNNICLIDKNEEKLQGEVMDLKYGSKFLNSPKITYGTDYCVSELSDIVIVTAGVRQRTGTSQLDLIDCNIDILKDMIPCLVKYSPEAVFIIVTNPVDLCTYVAWKLSGLPKNQVIGSGTNLDTSQFQYLISQKLGVSSFSTNGWIIGEHGSSSIPIWSSVSVGSSRLRDINQYIGTDSDNEGWIAIHKELIKNACEVTKYKGYTSWAIGLSVTSICATILGNLGNVHAVSTCVKGIHGIDKEVFLSLPCVLGKGGVVNIIKQNLSQSEREKLQKSANKIYGLGSEFHC